jgi:hypothetical protein
VSTVLGPYYFSWFDNEQCRNPHAGYLELHLRLNRGRVDQVGTMKSWPCACQSICRPLTRLRIHRRDDSTGH